MLTYELQRNVSRALEIFCLIVRDINMPGAHRGQDDRQEPPQETSSRPPLHGLKFLVLS